MAVPPAVCTRDWPGFLTLHTSCGRLGFTTVPWALTYYEVEMNLLILLPLREKYLGVDRASCGLIEDQSSCGRGKSSCLFPWLAVAFDNAVLVSHVSCTIW